MGGDHLGKEIIEIKQSATSLERRLRVAAYARVSSGKDAMLHSLAAQIDYYRNLINSNVQWQFAGVYADEAKTGTKEERYEFQLLLTKCRDGSVEIFFAEWIQSNDSFWICTPFCIPKHPLRTIVNRIA